MANTAASVLSVARRELGYSRYNDPEAGTKYGRWYAKDHGSYYGTTGVPYCAMFVSWVFSQAGATCAGLPEAYCPYIRNKARSAGAVLADKTRAQPGDVILFDWGTDGVEDHVGIVEANFGSYVQTIEGNVSGCVARRTRYWSDVTYVVRPNYDPIEEVSVKKEANAVYRMYNPNNGAHHFTSSHNEAESLADAGWIYEGVGMKCVASGGIKLYRMYNANNGDHIYTPRLDEVGSTVVAGWVYEGVAWQAPSTGKEVYRMYNPNNGLHTYTASTTECDALVKAGWINEGSSFCSD